MGKGPSELQREIAEQREIIDRRLAGLENRLADDLESFRSQLSDSAGSMFGLEDQVRTHPLISVAAALGAGVVLGMASEGRPGDRRNGRRRGSEGGLMAGLLTAAGGTVRDEVTEYVRYVAAGFARQHDHQEDERLRVRDEERSEEREEARAGGRRRGNGVGGHGEDERA